MIYFVGIEGLALVGAPSGNFSTSFPALVCLLRPVISRSQRRALSKRKSATVFVFAFQRYRIATCDKSGKRERWTALSRETRKTRESEFNGRIWAFGPICNWTNGREPARGRAIRARSAHELRDKCKSTLCTGRFCRSARRDRKLAAFGPDRAPTFANIGNRRRDTRRTEHPRARLRGKAAYASSGEAEKRVGGKRCLISIYHRSASRSRA